LRTVSPARLALAFVIVAGLALRLVLSRAPLWNDEIWSIQNLKGIDGVRGILWGLSHDNNHFLNSIWLYLVAPATSNPTLLRLVSILAGVLTIPAMARLGARRGPAAGLVAGALTAFSFFQVVYSVEARGYAVATLALAVAWAEIEAERGSRLRLALACGLGFFAHLAFGPALAGLAFATFLENIRRARGSALAAFPKTLRLFWPAALACLPTLGFFFAGYINKSGFTIGSLTPFSLAHGVGGVTSLAMMTFGLDSTSYVQTVFALVGLPLIVLAAIVFLAPAERRAVYLVMLVLLPALALILRIPNTHVGRYFFAASPFLILLAADSFGALWARGMPARALAALALAPLLTSDVAAIVRLARGECAPWTEALAHVAASPQRALASSHDFNVGKSVAYYGGLTLVTAERLCDEKPSWYVLETRGDGKAEAELTLCGRAYRLEGVYDRDIPSQLPWALYARAD
jgi:hypothetical protein